MLLDHMIFITDDMTHAFHLRHKFKFFYNLCRKTLVIFGYGCSVHSAGLEVLDLRFRTGNRNYLQGCLISVSKILLLDFIDTSIRAYSYLLDNFPSFVFRKHSTPPFYFFIWYFFPISSVGQYNFQILFHITGAGITQFRGISTCSENHFRKPAVAVGWLRHRITPQKADQCLLPFFKGHPLGEGRHERQAVVIEQSVHDNAQRIEICPEIIRLSPVYLRSQTSTDTYAYSIRYNLFYRPENTNITKHKIS